MTALGGLAVLMLATGVPIFFVLGLTAMFAVVAGDLPLVLLAHRFYTG